MIEPEDWPKVSSKFGISTIEEHRVDLGLRLFALFCLLVWPLLLAINKFAKVEDWPTFKYVFILVVTGKIREG